MTITEQRNPEEALDDDGWTPYCIRMVSTHNLPSPNMWVSIKDEVRVDRYTWYRIDKHEYVLSSDVWLASPSTFQGVAISERRQSTIGFVIFDWASPSLPQERRTMLSGEQNPGTWVYVHSTPAGSASAGVQ